MKRVTLHLISTALFVVLSLPAVFAQSDEEGGRTIWDGVYNEAQADRGRNAYVASCAQCHRVDLSGFEGKMEGQGFMASWGEDSAKSLFDRIQTTMPLGQPGSLSNQAYVDIVAFFFSRNQFPAGAEELALDKLDQIRIQKKAGPADVPNLSLVQVIGCLEQESSSSYNLTHATSPVRVRGAGASTGEELEAAKATPLGTETYELLRNVKLLKPENYAGHRVEAKGYLIRNKTGLHLNVSALQSFAESCGN